MKIENNTLIRPMFIKSIVYLRMVIGQKSAYDVHSFHSDFQTRLTIEMSTAMDMYISYKFGGLLSSTSVVNAAQLCTAGIDQHSGNSSTFTKRQHVYVSLLLARARHCYAGRAIRMALSRIFS